MMKPTKPTPQHLEIGGSLLARNTLLNFIGQAVPLLVGVASIPFIVRGLGTERFGLFSLAWVILGYFAIFDLGLGRATTKFVIMDLLIRPQLRKFSGSLTLFPRLFSFGGWVTVTSIVGPILVYLDRFLIGSLLSMSAVAYYSVPYEAVTRLWIIPASLTMFFVNYLKAPQSSEKP